ncbi:arylesterase [Primorskyibacter sp. S87]|uniref:arylesterase n=1 Tax=Primorskyibacter sp. S87 TaxID=3415126 RepID=UPI003C7CD68A
MRKVMLVLVSVLWGAAATAGPVTVAALGDSLTQGYGLPPEEGFVPQLERWLLDQGVDAELINAGVSGDTTAGGAARVAWTLTPEVDAMIVALGGNDVLRGIEPAVARDNLETILSAAEAAEVAVLLVGLQAPGNYGAVYKEDFEAIYPDLSKKFGTFYAENFFAGLNAGGDPEAARSLMQNDGIHPNSEGVTRIVTALGPHVLKLIASVE